MNTKFDDQRTDKAVEKFQMIAELVKDGTDSAQKKELRERIAAESDISIRTVQRYEKAFREKGFTGLCPGRRTGQSSKLPEGYDELIQEAIQLRREVPSRSVSLIIFTLEAEGKAPPGLLKVSTVQKKLAEAGFSKKQMRKYKEDTQRTDASRRFCKPHRMMLIQADIKYGTGIMITENGKKKTLYLSSLIDDHSRFILESEWYEKQDECSVTDVFRKAIMKYGKFDEAYTDNGSVYISKQITTSCAMLNIKLRKARVRSGKSKGKIEKFHQVVDKYVEEVKLKNLTSAAEINAYWKEFLDIYYHDKPHEGIKEYYESRNIDVPKEGITPRQEWNRDTRALTYFNPENVAEAFRFHDTRTVDKGGLISWDGKKYEVNSSLIGCKVTVSYDPGDKTDILIFYKDYEPVKAKPVSIGSYCRKDTAVPIAVMDDKPNTSRVLDAIEKQYRERQKKLTDGISYSSFMSGEEHE